MAYGDVRYAFVANGSTVTAASGTTGLYGNFSGLSLLNGNEVVHILLSASGGDFRMSLNATGATNNIGLRMFAAASTFSLPPLSVTEASQITFAREGTSNPVAFWTILRRVP